MATLTGFTRPTDPIIADDLSTQVSSVLASAIECIVIDASNITCIGDAITEGDRVAIQAVIDAYEPVVTSAAAVTDATVSFSDITTNNFSITKHGYVPKGTNVGSFLKDDGTWATPAGSGDFVKAVDDTDDITEGTVKKFTTTAEKASWDAKAAASHTHAIADTTGLQAALDGKAATLGVDDNYVTAAEKTKLTNLSGVNSGDNAANTLYSGLAASKQDTLVSATNIKTVNGASILGSGDLTVSGAGYTAVATLASNAATAANVNPIDLTGLVFTYAINSVYIIRFMGRVAPGAATTGCGFQFNTSSVVSEINVSFYHQLANTGTLAGGHSIADDLSVGVSSGMPGTSDYPVVGHAVIRTGANTGTAQLRMRAEVAAVITAKAGFTMVVEKVS